MSRMWLHKSIKNITGIILCEPYNIKDVEGFFCEMCENYSLEHTEAERVSVELIKLKAE